MKNTRLIKFHSYADHPWLHRVYKKLTTEERALAVKFIEDTQWMTTDEYVPAVQRMFLGKPEKPKHWAHIMELLTCAGTAG